MKRTFCMLQNNYEREVRQDEERQRGIIYKKKYQMMDTYIHVTCTSESTFFKSNKERQ